MTRNLEREISLLSDLTRNLTLSRPAVRSFMTEMAKQDRLKIDLRFNTEESFTDINTPNGEKSVYRIELGMQPNSADIIRKLIFAEHNFSQEDLLLYRLLHEVSHVQVNELLDIKNNFVKTLLNVCIGQNKIDQRFFTGLGKFKSGRAWFGGYKPRKDAETVSPFEEDAVELVTMQLWNPEYLSAYLEYLTNQRMKRDHQNMGVRTLSVEHAAAIHKLITDVAESDPFKEVDPG